MKEQKIFLPSEDDILAVEIANITYDERILKETVNNLSLDLGAECVR